MYDKCCKCAGNILPGQPVFQLAIGKYFPPAITPTMPVHLGNWHKDHVNESVFRPQGQPYHCAICNDEIAGTEQVLYGVIGKQPEWCWIRAESRGYVMQLVACKKCWGTEQIKQLLDEATVGETRRENLQYPRRGGGQHGR